MTEDFSTNVYLSPPRHSDYLTVDGLSFRILDMGNSNWLKRNVKIIKLTWGGGGLKGFEPQDLPLCSILHYTYYIKETGSFWKKVKL